MHKSLHELEFPPDPTTDYRVSCPCVSEKMYYDMATLTPSFLNESSSFLQVTMAIMKSRTSLKFV